MSTAADTLHACEVRDIVRRFFPDGHAAAEFMEQVEKKRGHLAAQKLRDDVRAEWKKRQKEKTNP